MSGWEPLNTGWHFCQQLALRWPGCNRVTSNRTSQTRWLGAGDPESRKEGPRVQRCVFSPVPGARQGGILPSQAHSTHTLTPKPDHRAPNSQCPCSEGLSQGPRHQPDHTCPPEELAFAQDAGPQRTATQAAHSCATSLHTFGHLDPETPETVAGPCSPRGGGAPIPARAQNGCFPAGQLCDVGSSRTWCRRHDGHLPSRQGTGALKCPTISGEQVCATVHARHGATHVAET